MTINQPDSPVHGSAFGCITIPFLLLAISTLAWGARANWSNGELARRGEVVTGRVIELRFVASNPGAGSQGTRGGNARGESPVATFTTRAGEERTVVGSMNRYPPPWKVGQPVDIVYDAASPDRADLLEEVGGWRWWFALWCAAAAAFVAVAMLPVGLLMRQRRRQRATN